MDKRNSSGLYVYLLEQQIRNAYYETCAVFSTPEAAMYAIAKENTGIEYNWIPEDKGANPELAWIAKTRRGNWRVAQVQVDGR